VAHIHAGSAAETKRLAAVELVPAPAGGRDKSLKCREIQDLLALQGLKLVEHSFSGAATVNIAAQGLASAPATLQISQRAAEQAHARVERAIVSYLQSRSATLAAWEVEFELSPAEAELIGARLTELHASGGSEPWTGEQTFTLALRTTKGLKRFNVQAQVGLPDRVVVPRRPLRRGEVLQASDLTLEMPTTAVDTGLLATRLEDVIGRETTRSVATGQPLEAGWLKKPVMVRRGEVVTVFARAANVQVRTSARAQQEGGHGDVITVERLDNRQRFTARVVGVQELEVFVGGVSVNDRTAQR
jgi:flagella basal body P-ring formation protein FlgA